MKFNFKGYIENIKNGDNEDKKNFLKEYEDIVGKITSLKKEKWFKNYVKKFSDYVIIPDTDDTIRALDWDLLVKLIFASFSSTAEYSLEKTKDNIVYVALKVNVTSENQNVTKSMDELWAFQIQRLFDIYISEQMNLEKLFRLEKPEKKAIKWKRKELIKHAQKQWAKIHLQLLNYPDYVYNYHHITELIENLEFETSKKILFSKN